MEKLNGFKLVNRYDLEEYRSEGLEYVHEKTGLKLFHIHNDDVENTFSFSFNTPVENSTGVPHIIEHSVLSGSRKYDLKDPFQSMMKGSVNTFLNAYTFPDKTSYPASSVLEKDFFNLMSVYADAVFFPSLTKETFLQEGWRLCVDEKDELYHSGVVFNEMKGVYSSHDSIVADMSVKSLFSEGGYTHDSGGDPWDIPELTYEAFKGFHDKWYKPSNCYVYIYGNIPTEKTLAFLEENFLSDLDVSSYIDGTTISDEVWSEPRSFYQETPAIEEKDNATDLLLSWKLFDMSNPEDGLALEILNRILLGSSAAPLHKVLMESEEWDDLSSASGLENELCNFIYTVGVRGASPDKMDNFRDTVYKTLQDVVKKGLNPELVEGALRGIEFKNREIQGSLGLRLMRKVIRGWMHGQSPISTLEFEKWMKNIREKSKEKGYYESLISKYLLNNKHRADVVVEPSLAEATRIENATAERLKVLKAGMSPLQIKEIKNENEQLKAYQDRPDSKESLAALPRLTKEDIPSDVTYINTSKESVEGFDYYSSELYTNGIVYFGIGFSMEYLDKFFFEYLLIFTRMMTNAGFKDRSYDEVSKLVSLHLGGLGASMETSNRLKNGKPDMYIENLYIRGKVLEHSLEDGIQLVIDFLTKIDFHDYKRLKTVITELRNDLKASLVPNGTSYAALRSARKFSLASCREESWYGVTQAQFLDNLVKRVDEPGILEDIAKALDAMKRELITKQGLFFHSSLDKKYDKRLRAAFKSVVDELPDGDGFIHPAEHYDLEHNVEGLVGNTQVSYAGLTIKGAFLGSKEYASQALLCYILKTGYLWENVRMKGGAYGVFVSPSGLDGAITFGSYRDPNITSTLNHFREGLEWVAAGHISQEEIDLALISVIGKELKPLTPVEKSIIGMRRKLLGITDELRINKRSYLMAVTPEDLMNFSAVLLHHFDDHSVVVLSSKESLESAAEEVKGLTENLIDLPS